jgi:hypothetical protein
MRHHLVDVLGLKKKSIGFGLYSVPLGRGTKDEVKRWDGGILVDFAAPECQLKQIHPEEHQPADFFLISSWNLLHHSFSPQVGSRENQQEKSIFR